MQPRFIDEFTLQLKRITRARLATEGKFTHDDVVALTESTGLTAAAQV